MAEINQTHITIGYFVYATSDMSITEVYDNYADMFDDWPGKNKLMVRELSIMFLRTIFISHLVISLIKLSMMFLTILVCLLNMRPYHDQH